MEERRQLSWLHFQQKRSNRSLSEQIKKDRIVSRPVWNMLNRIDRIKREWMDGWNRFLRRRDSNIEGYSLASPTHPHWLFGTIRIWSYMVVVVVVVVCVCVCVWGGGGGGALLWSEWGRRQSYLQRAWPGWYSAPAQDTLCSRFIGSTYDEGDQLTLLTLDLRPPRSRPS